MTASGSGPHIKQRCNRPGCGILHQGVEIMRWISMLHEALWQVLARTSKGKGMGRWRAATSSAGAENEQGEAGDVVLAPSLGQIREAWKAVEPASGAGHPVTNVIKVEYDASVQQTGIKIPLGVQPEQAKSRMQHTLQSLSSIRKH